MDLRTCTLHQEAQRVNQVQYMQLHALVRYHMISVIMKIAKFPHFMCVQILLYQITEPWNVFTMLETWAVETKYIPKFLWQRIYIQVHVFAPLRSSPTPR